MSDEPFLTLQQLANVLRVPEIMVSKWESDGILPTADVSADEAARYRQRDVVVELRKHPEIMQAVKAAMSARAQDQ